VQFAMHLLVPTVLTAFWIWFHNKRLKISTWNNTIRFYGIQRVLSFLVNNSVFMEFYDKGSMRKARYVYRYQQALNKFHITKEVWALQLSLGNILRILPYHEFTLIRGDNELQSKRYWNSGSSNRQMVIEDNRTAAQKMLPNILYHHP
jgi:hypothetical protein